MADVMSAVRTYLLSKSAITTLIGQRIYFDTLKQNATLPAVTMAMLTQRHEHTLSDISGLRHTRISFECFSPTRLTSNQVADTIITCGIAAVKGLTNSVDIRSVMVEEGQRTFLDEDTAGGDDHRYVTAFDLMVSHLG